MPVPIPDDSEAGCSDFAGSVFSGSVLSGSVFAGSVLAGSVFAGSVFVGAASSSPQLPIIATTKIIAKK
uniref:pentapeptide repeat-containing protein n=1 Tax=Tumebacillus algifaecis TaxID=1214604 RepID=UPI001D131134